MSNPMFISHEDIQNRLRKVRNQKRDDGRNGGGGLKVFAVKPPNEPSPKTTVSA